MNNNTFIVKIHDLAFGGDGVGRLEDGRVIFVPQTVIGDNVRVSITATSSRFLRGKVVEILTPGPGRQTPECAYFGQCGGCCYQHLDYSYQLQAKKNQLVSLLKRLGKVEDLPEIQLFSSPDSWHYRNKLKLAMTPDHHLGFYTADNETIIPITECKLATMAINQALKEFDKQKQPQGESITFRQGADNQVDFFLNQGRDCQKSMTEELASGKVQVPIQSFWQVNPRVARLMLQMVAEKLIPQNLPIFIDAYSGMGPFSLEIGNKAQHHILIEIDKRATLAAKKYMQERHLGAPEVYNGATEKILPKVLQKLGKKTSQALVLLDPPRTGCEKEVITALRNSEVKQIIYISCHPATLSRDLQRLGLDHGEWQIKELALFDMFPQTAHFETVVWVSRKEK